MADPMSPEELRTILDELGWNQSDLAKHAKRDFGRIRKMASGRGAVDEELAGWLRTLSRLHHHLLEDPTYVEFVRLRRVVAAARLRMSKLLPTVGGLPAFNDLIQLIDEGVPIKRS